MNNSTANNSRRLVIAMGGAGFIGSGLVDALLARGFRLRVVVMLGVVRKTIGTFLKQYSPAPVVAMLNDLDLCTSAAALHIFDNEPGHFLPRVFTYSPTS